MHAFYTQFQLCLPIHYEGVMEYNVKNENINIEQKCYIKASKTFLSRSGINFFTLLTDINIKEIRINNIFLQIFRKRSNISPIYSLRIQKINKTSLNG